MRSSFFRKSYFLFLSTFILGPLLEPKSVFATDLQLQLPSLQIYGFILPNIIGATRGVESFSQPNMSAFTAAGNPLLATSPNQSRATFQVAQSRLGFLMGSKTSVQGRLEFDFVDFTKASPTTASVPRLRRATVEYHVDEHNVIVMGQDWDLFSAFHPIDYNFVGHYFESGSSGFMRQQLTWIRTTSDLELGGSIGLQTANPNAPDGNVELSKFPAFVVRGAYLFGEHNRVGLSGIASQLLVDRTTDQKLPAYGVKGFSEFFLAGGDLDIRTEIYAGRNLFNLGTLTLSYGSALSDVAEVGGWMTGRYSLSQKFGIFGGGGIAKVLNPQRMLASYTLSPAGVYSLAGTGPGIERNWTVRIGAEYKPEPLLSIFAEVAYLNTLHHFGAVAPASASIASPLQTATVAFGGMMLNI
jgi:hypothetical protein